MKVLSMAMAIFTAVAVTGCADEPEPEVCEPDFDYAYEPGQLWGPCRDDGTCGPFEGVGPVNLLCQQKVDPFDDTVTASICVPYTCGWDLPTCAPVRELTLHEGDGCMQPCYETTDCVGGQVCESYGAGYCMWPTDVSGDGDGDQAPQETCGWSVDETLSGYWCGGQGSDPDGMHPFDCPEEGLVDGAACGDVTLVGCCDSDGHNWYCAGGSLTRVACF